MNVTLDQDVQLVFASLAHAIAILLVGVSLAIAASIIGRELWKSIAKLWTRPRRSRPNLRALGVHKTPRGPK